MIFHRTLSHRAIGWFGIAVAGAALLPMPAAAQQWPAKPIRMIVPYSAGGGADNAARILAQRLGTTLRAPVVIENRPGASGIIGAQAVAKADPDGYTMLYDASTFAVNPLLRKMPFDPAADLMPVSLVLTVPNILVVPSKGPAADFKAFVARARVQPDKVSFASYGAGSPAHLAGELLNREARIGMLHVPYKGGAPALADVIGGQVDAYFANAGSALGYVQSGQLKALAVTSRRRMAALPEVPTVAESGFPNFEVLEWNGVFVPKGTAQPIVDRLASEIQAAVRDPETRARLVKSGADPVGGTPIEFTTFIAGQTQRWAQLIKTNKITAD
ncbi:tripartite-type tricarboxylate transporter receptor subunit TctC [Variovorax boronicumulans]|uniref:Tripartite-type tricarboxylate transporter receptor subunit TctC n=1 Tax=Variovorax boronicumulans TaxID=436515 RepID=A0AAW8DVL8_9BURK|nr:tripartite tricarboxylate transporter substrate binding protein [Variovorax boronicumulans]MDP9877893.1 tripartite-type tricarboxylate transporter receptor subunit TctC [Variovorax boronicumulans]MDP9923177.1 tripartite-type tricarboxylate transporter receptor subunit TctC [Variovorax boronicumulans]